MAEEENWEHTYQSSKIENLPWYSPKLDKDVAGAIKKLGLKGGIFLDLGTGPATQAIELAKLGFDVVGTDISPTAIEKAQLRAKKENVKIKFIADDILETKLKQKEFDFILDRGVFHTKDPELREKFIENIKRILKPDGIYFMKCFSTKTPGTWGPHRFTKEQIKQYFGDKFEILSIKESTFAGALEGDEPKTLFCIMKPKQ